MKKCIKHIYALLLIIVCAMFLYILPCRADNNLNNGLSDTITPELKKQLQSNTSDQVTDRFQNDIIKDLAQAQAQSLNIQDNPYAFQIQANLQQLEALDKQLTASLSCEQIRQKRIQSSISKNSLGAGIVPDSVLTSIYNTTKLINDKVALLLTLGQSLTCHAVHAGRESVDILGVELFKYPDISVWICGLIIYLVGYMMTISITFYVVDIAFKLGFAIIMLPIGIALWPFPPTKDKLTFLISIILKSAAIFVFLSLTVTYTVTLIDSALDMDLEPKTTDTITMPDFLASIFPEYLFLFLHFKSFHVILL